MKGQGQLREVKEEFEAPIEVHGVVAAATWIASCYPLQNFFEILVVR